MKYDILPDDVVGEVFENNDGQKYKVIRKSGRKQNGCTTYLIRFLDTGYEKVIEKVQIKRGKVKDKLEKSILGIASMGDIKMVDHKREYNIWYKMLERCYNPALYVYRSYGAKGVTVCDRWLCFSNFVEDVPEIDGYNKELFDSGVLFLDKDIKQPNISNKLYSKDTCTFVDFETNNLHRDNEHRKIEFFGLSPDNELITIKGLKEFSRQKGIHRTRVAACLSNKARTTSGWRFSYSRKELENIVAKL